ncbi:glycosyltransferase family 39 protein [Streptomyces sp. TRM76323]|uniref:Glycosyltransferase family 39 protein n=1 Tax=Streptomyces tamarix TaxID=3078565 RepID=A0ABU3QH14_9ACTN|nr:glycosyltransferase family 39 protein [Streptomyces tamarix]MDT9682062.1 glycosyltransferase family 39 protein [Streptomyces tamarix]
MAKFAAVRPRRSCLLVRLVPFLWTVALGLWGLSRQHSVWRDEAATWQVALRSTGEIVRMLEHVDVVHGFYYLLMHGLFECFGPSTTVLRLPSVLAVAVGAACVAELGRRLAGSPVGLGGGMVFGLLPSVQFYLQEGRPYALVAAGAGLSTLLLVAMLQGRRDRWAYWVGYGCTVLVCGLLNWLSLLILPAHLATLAWARVTRGTWIHWVVSSAAVTAGAAPLILFSRAQSDQVSWIPPLTWHMLIGPTVLLAIAGLGALLDQPRTGRLSAATVGLPLLAVPQLGLVGISLFKPLFVDRYVLFSLLGLALMIGVVLGALVRAVSRRSWSASRWVLPVAVAVVSAALLPQALAKRSPQSRVDDVMAVAAQVKRLKEPEDAVLFVPAARRDTRMVSPDAFTGLQDIALEETPERSGTLKGVEWDPARIRTEILAQQRVVLVTDAAEVSRPTVSVRDKTKISTLRKYFTPVADEQVRGRRVTVYERLTPGRPS